jgi:osmotically-inducible protein OsmY
MRKIFAATALASALPFAAIAQTSSTTTTTTTTGPATAETTTITGGTGQGTVSASGVLVNADTDRALMSEIATALAATPALAGASIDVQVVGGRVTLNGSARDMAQVESAKGVAQGIAGAANVTSNLSAGR